MSIAFFWAFWAKSRKAVCCTPGTSADGGTYLEIEEIAFMTALCGSVPIPSSGSAACRMLIASLTFDIAPALAPGDPEGVEIGLEPIGGWPESEGGIMGRTCVVVRSLPAVLAPTSASETIHRESPLVAGGKREPALLLVTLRQQLRVLLDQLLLGLFALLGACAQNIFMRRVRQHDEVGGVDSPCLL